MASHLGTETIIARYFSEMIKTLEVKTCDYCQVGTWSVLTIAVNANTGGKTGFTIFSRLQCLECEGLDAKTWKFDPYAKVKR